MQGVSRITGLPDAIGNGEPVPLSQAATLIATGTAGLQAGFDAALALKAPLASPALTGVPTAPTASAGTNTTQLATMAAIQTAIANLVASSPSTLDTLNELAAALGNDPNFATTITTALGLKAPLASPTFTGTPAAPTPSPGDNTTKIATMAALQAATVGVFVDLLTAQTIAGIKTFGSSPVVPDATTSGQAASKGQMDTALALKANLASPTFTGTPAAPTPAAADSTTKISTTAFVQGEIASKAPLASPALTGTPTAPTASAGTNTTQVATTAFVQGEKASPAFTGTPTAPTATAGTNTTQIATMAAVQTAIANLIASAPGALDTLNELAAALGNDAAFSTTVTNALALKAPLASPTFTGVPLSTTPSAADSTTKIATTAFVQGELTAKANLASPTFTGAPLSTTPAAADNTTKIATTAYVQGEGFAKLTNRLDQFAAPNVAVDWNAKKITGLADPTLVQDAATKAYVDATVAGGGIAYTGGGGIGLSGTVFFVTAGTGLTQDADGLTVNTAVIAPLASPTFTGTPAAPTPAAADSTTKIATTAFVQGELTAKAPLASPTFTGTPLSTTPSAADSSTKIATTAFVQGELTAKAPLASPTFTGTPLSTTPAAADNSTKIATTAYVDAADGAVDHKNSCRVATTANITLSGTQTIDGVAVIAAERVLVKDQTTGSQNGIYACAAGAWARATDADISAEVTSGANVFISEGTANAGKKFFLTTADPITLGTTALVFAEIAVNLTTAQTVAGVKTFSSSPVIPDATTSAQAASKGQMDTADALKAPLASPTFTGTPLSTTPSAADNTTKIATTAFVQGELTAKAPLASPTFTGTPAAPTAAVSTNTTQLATTAFVQAALPAAVTASTQAQMETGTDTTTMVTPGRVIYCAGVAKAWAKSTISGTMAASYNMTSVTDYGTGDLGYTMATAFSSTSYNIHGSTIAGSAYHSWFSTGTALTASFVRAKTDPLQDPTNWFFSASGDQ